MKLRWQSQGASGIAAAVMATIFWTAGSLLTKHALPYFQPIDLALDELAAGTASLWAVLVLRGWRRRSLTTILRLAWPGLLQPGLAYLLAFVGLQWTTVSLETLLWSSEAALMIPFAFFFLGESVSLRTGSLGGLAVGGVVLATLPSALKARAGTTALAGDALILAAVLAACGYTVLAQRDLRDNDPLLLVALHHLAGVALVVMVRAVRPDLAFNASPSHGLAIYAEVGMAGICLFSAPFWLYLRSIQILGSAKASQFLPLVPVLTMLLASQLLDERITVPQAIGSAVTVAAVFALSVAEAKSKPKQRILSVSHRDQNQAQGPGTKSLEL
jgi:drug/metabolite transporter (DMT)-like permease